MSARQALLVLAATGIALVTALSSCSKQQIRGAAAAGFVAAYDCELAHADPAVVDDLKAAARAKVDGWISGKAPADLPTLIAKVKADLMAFKSDAGRCALVTVVAAATALVAPPSDEAISALTAAGPDPATVRVAFEIAAREAGWAPVKVTGGTTL